MLPCTEARVSLAVAGGACSSAITPLYPCCSSWPPGVGATVSPTEVPIPGGASVSKAISGARGQR